MAIPTTYPLAARRCVLGRAAPTARDGGGRATLTLTLTLTPTLTLTLTPTLTLTLTTNPDPNPHQVTLLEVEGDHKLMSLGPDGEVMHSTERLTLSLLRASTLPSYHP